MTNDSSLYQSNCPALCKCTNGSHLFFVLVLADTGNFVGNYLEITKKYFTFATSIIQYN